MSHLGQGLEEGENSLLSWLQHKCRSAPKEQRGWKTRASSPSSFPVPCPSLSLTKFLQAAESKRQTRGHKNCVEKAEQSELNTSARGRGCCSPVSPWLLRKPLTDTTQRLGCARCVTKSWQGNIFKREFHFTQSHNETGSFPNEICGQSVNWILPLTCKRYLNPHEAQCLTKPQLRQQHLPRIWALGWIFRLKSWFIGRAADGFGFRPSYSFWSLVKFEAQKKPNSIIISNCQEGIPSAPSSRRKSTLSSSNQFHLWPSQQNTFCLWFVFSLGHTDFRPSVDCNV